MLTKSPKPFYASYTKPPSVRYVKSRFKEEVLFQRVDRILRVDHAGEIGARAIYSGQLCVLASGSEAARAVQHMKDQEMVHVKEFQRLVRERGIRPSALLPCWEGLGFLLGAVTAALGPQTAMACTVAVEDVISKHYDNQLRELIEDDVEEHRLLLDTIRKFRDEEIKHHDLALDHEASSAPGYDVISGAIKLGCYAAIWCAERI